MKEELRLKIEERRRRKEESLGQTSVNEGDVGVLRCSPSQKIIKDSVSREDCPTPINRRRYIREKIMTSKISFRCPPELKVWLKTKGHYSKYIVRVLTKLKAQLKQ